MNYRKYTEKRIFFIEIWLCNMGHHWSFCQKLAIPHNIPFMRCRLCMRVVCSSNDVALNWLTPSDHIASSIIFL